MYQYAIETNGLKKQFREHIAINDVNIHVKRGTIYGLLGRNGSGKTTTMRMLMGLVKPTAGEIRLFGQRHYKNTKEIYNKMGSLVETPGFYENLTARENLSIFARLRGLQRKDAIHRALEVVELEGDKKKRFGHYSMGMKQRLGIALAIMHEPELLILDEPINGLDPIGIREVRNFLAKMCREREITIMISSHILSEIDQMADTIGVLHDGKLIEEIEMTTLKKKNRQYMEFQVSDEKKASLLLEDCMNIKNYSIHGDNRIRIYTHFGQQHIMNKLFVDHGIDVSRIYINKEKLEDYFSNMIGGRESVQSIIL